MIAIKSEREIKDKLQELKRDRKTLHDYMKQRGTPTTLPDLTAILTQQLDEHSISAKIDFAEWVLKDYPF